MKTTAELKQFIEMANPLTNWHVTILETFIKLHKIDARHDGTNIILTEQDGNKTTIKN